MEISECLKTKLTGEIFFIRDKNAYMKRAQEKLKPDNFMTLKVKMTFMFAITYLLTWDLMIRKVTLTFSDGLTLLMTPKGNMFIRDRSDLFYTPKGHSDLVVSLT